MKKMKHWMVTTMMMVSGICTFLYSCKGCSKGLLGGDAHVCGTLDAPLKPDSAPAWLLEAMERAERFHNSDILTDETHAISVEAIGEVDTIPTQGYGIVVVKGAVSTTFPQLRNSREPKARFDGKNQWLWLSCSVMEGTGVQVERLFQIRFDNDDKAYIAHIIEPYTLQQALCERLSYSIDGEQITLYDGEDEIARATNTVTDMGGFDSDAPLWIGDQMQFDLSGDVPLLLVTPGVDFTTGLVLIYDDMPTLIVPLTITDQGIVDIGKIKVRPE